MWQYIGKCCDIDTKKEGRFDPLVIRMRLERMTVCLEGRCSIQLSYRTILFCSAKLDICTGLRKFC